MGTPFTPLLYDIVNYASLSKWGGFEYTRNQFQNFCKSWKGAKYYVIQVIRNSCRIFFLLRVKKSYAGIKPKNVAF